MHRVCRSLGICVVVLLSLLRGTASAAPVLLTSAFESQLETWLGQGDLAFANIFEKQLGNTGTDFHAAADGQGATFTLLEAIVGDTTYVIGGYNPQSWDSFTGFNFTPLDADRTAFIYNLSDATLRTQKLTTDPPAFYGDYQTYNTAAYGPVFGGGFDLYANQTLTSGHDFAYSYGPGVSTTGSSGLIAIDNAYCGAGCTYTTFTIGRLETYTFAQAPTTNVPEPASVSLLVLGMAAVVAARQRHTTSVQG